MFPSLVYDPPRSGTPPQSDTAAWHWGPAYRRLALQCPVNWTGEKTTNSGLHAGLADEKHRQAMGDAIWLFIWLVGAQTRRNGLVYGGKPLTFAAIRERTGYNERSIRRWMVALREAGYIEIKYSIYKRLVIRVLKQKKFTEKQAELPLSNRPDVADQAPVISANFGLSDRPNVADTAARSGRFKNDIKSDKGAPDGSPSPIERLGVPLSLWNDYKKLRERLHRPIISGGEDYVFLELVDLKGRGCDPVEVLTRAVATSSWKLCGPNKKHNQHKGGESENERRQRKTAAAVQRALQKTGPDVADQTGHTLPHRSQRERN